MPDEKTNSGSHDIQIEERGVVTDVIVPLAQAGVAGAVGAAVNNHLSKPKDPPPPPPPANGE
jgi:hypothetical protein